MHPRPDPAGLRVDWSDVVGLRAGDRYLVVNPFFHAFGYKAGIVASLMRGATIVPHAVFDPATALARVAEEHITMLPGPPALYQTILNDPGCRRSTSRRCAWRSPAPPSSPSS